MTCEGCAPGAAGPFARYLPGVLGCERFATGQTRIPALEDASQVRVASELEGRRSLTLTNAGAVVVFIGPDPNVTPSTGFPLAPGTGLTIDSRAEVFACGDPDNPSDAGTLAWLAEIFVPGCS